MYYPLEILKEAENQSPEDLLDMIKDNFHCDQDVTVKDLYEYIYSFKFFKNTYSGPFEKCNRYIMFDKEINKMFFPMFSMSQFEERSTEWKDIFSTTLALYSWKNSKMVYKIDNDFFHELKQTEDLVTTEEMFNRLPFKCFYVDLMDVKDISDFIGAWVYITKDEETGYIGVNVYMISEKDNTFYTYYAWYNFNEEPEIKWNVNELPGSVFIRRDIREAKKGLLTDITEVRDDYDPRNDIIVALFQIMSFISVDASDISESPVTKKTYKPHKKSEIKNVFSEVMIWDVGIRYGKAIKVAKQEYKKSLRKPYNITKERKPVRPHVRRAHWQRYHVGKNRQDIKTKWIAPVYVCGNGKEIPVTIREIKK